MEQLFKLISQEENCECKVKHETAYSPFTMSRFSRIPAGFQVKSLALNISYKGQNIEVLNKLSNNQVGELKCSLKTNLRLPHFQITNRSPYWRLLNRKIKALKISCDDHDFKMFLEEKLSDLKLEEIAKKSLFEPVINGTKQNDIYELSTTYHLAFPNKKEVLKPLIILYKALIDYAIEINRVK